MFGIDSTELLIIIVVAVLVIGPKDLPRALYKVGQVVGKARAMSRHFRTGLDAMIREAELEELQKQWDKENARIMAEHPLPEAVMTEKPIVDETLEPGAASVDAAPPQDEPATDMSLVEAVKVSQMPPPVPVAAEGASEVAPADAATAEPEPKGAAAS